MNTINTSQVFKANGEKIALPKYTTRHLRCLTTEFNRLPPPLLSVVLEVMPGYRKVLPAALDL